jgi:hypothetical protein
MLFVIGDACIVAFVVCCLKEHLNTSFDSELSYNVDFSVHNLAATLSNKKSYVLYFNLRMINIRITRNSSFSY